MCPLSKVSKDDDFGVIEVTLFNEKGYPADWRAHIFKYRSGQKILFYIEDRVFSGYITSCTHKKNKVYYEVTDGIAKWVILESQVKQVLDYGNQDTIKEKLSQIETLVSEIKKLMGA